MNQATAARIGNLKRSVKKDCSYGKTDEIRFNGVSGRVYVHELQIIILLPLGTDHENLPIISGAENFALRMSKTKE